MGQESAEALPGHPGQAHRDGPVRQAGMAAATGDLARQHGPDRPVHIAHGLLDHHRLAIVQGRHGGFDQPVVQGVLQAVILTFTVPAADLRRHVDLIQQPGQIDPLGLPVVHRRTRIQTVDPADHLAHRAEAHLGHDRPQFFGHEEEVVDHMLRLAGEPRAQHRILGRDPHRAGVQVALAHHDAAGRDQRRGGEAELVGPQQGGHGDVAPGAQAAVGLDRDTAAQAVEQQGLLGFGQADLPG